MIVGNRNSLRVHFHDQAVYAHLRHLSDVIGVGGFIIPIGCIGKKRNRPCTFAACQHISAIFVHAGDHAICRGGDRFALVHFKQFQHQRLILPMLAGKGFKFCGIAGVFQIKKHSACGHRCTFADPDAGNGAGISHHIPLAVDVQRPGADPVAVLGGDLYFLTNGKPIILNRHGQNTLQIGFHSTLHFRSIGKCNEDGIAAGEVCIALHLNCHQAVQ